MILNKNIKKIENKHTGKALIVHIIQFLSGLQLTNPTVDLKVGVSTSGGTGMKIRTSFAVDLALY